MSAPITERGRFHLHQFVVSAYFGRGQITKFHPHMQGIFVRWDRNGIETLMSPGLLTPSEEKPS